MNLFSQRTPLLLIKREDIFIRLGNTQNLYKFTQLFHMLRKKYCRDDIFRTASAPLFRRKDCLEKSAVPTIDIPVTESL
jgi:hypothetical protein